MGGCGDGGEEGTFGGLGTLICFKLEVYLSLDEVQKLRMLQPFQIPKGSCLQALVSIS